jgi:hypothetical protein
MLSAFKDLQFFQVETQWFIVKATFRFGTIANPFFADQSLAGATGLPYGFSTLFKPPESESLPMRSSPDSGSKAGTSLL